MGYRGKVIERQHARQLRRTGLPLAEIATRVGVSKSSVSLWVRDVGFDAPLPRAVRGRRRDPNALQRRKQGEIDRLLEEGRVRVGRLSEREFLVAGGDSFRSTRPGSGCACTCTRGWTWRPRSPSGPS
jgi:transposase